MKHSNQPITEISGIRMLEYVATFFILAILSIFVAIGAGAVDISVIAKSFAGLLALTFMTSLVYNFMTSEDVWFPL